MFCNWNGALFKKSARFVLTAGLLVIAFMLSSIVLVHGKGALVDIANDSITLAQLPVQGQDMMKKIETGGPFKYDKDGTVFGNRERLLPDKNRGFYREYTVKTPGESTRGARRIVCGGAQAVAPEACYYTDDHYASFRKIAR